MRERSCTSELKVERSKYSESEFIHRAKRTELQRLLEDERISHAEALLRHREEGEQAKRVLQARLGLRTRLVITASSTAA